MSRKTTGMKIKSFPFIILTIIFWSVHCWALKPEEVLVLANKMDWYSVELAKYYMNIRNIPKDNLIKLRAPSDEQCNRNGYERYIVSPIREFLNKKDPEGKRAHVCYPGLKRNTLPTRSVS